MNIFNISYLFLQIDTEDVRIFVNSRIQTDFKKVRGDVIMVKSIPRNSNGKIMRRKIENLAEATANIGLNIMSKNGCS